MGDLKKLGFMAVTPFKVKNKKELKSPKGFAKETANATIGYLAGGLAGGVIPAGLYLAAKRVSPMRMRAGFTGNEAHFINSGKAFGMAMIGGGLGGVTGGVRSLRKTEREAGVKPSGLGKFLIRGGSSAAGFIAGERATRGLGMPTSLVTGYL